MGGSGKSVSIAQCAAWCDDDSACKYFSRDKVAKNCYKHQSQSDRSCSLTTNADSNMYEVRSAGCRFVHGRRDHRLRW